MASKCKNCGKEYIAHGECEYYDSAALTNPCEKFVSGGLSE